MRAWLAILFTLGLLAASRVISALIYFDLTWILIWATSLWAGIDSSKIQLNRYKLAMACRPAALFCLCALLWIFIFPWYLWARYKIKTGTATLKEEPSGNVSPFRLFLRRFSRIAERVAEWCLIGLVGLKIVLSLFCLEEYWRGQRVWENYRQAWEAKGETFDWDSLIPPPVPDSRNIFSAPRMSEWFIKNPGPAAIPDDLAGPLNHTNTASTVLIAELRVEPPGASIDAGAADASLRLDDPESRRRMRELVQARIGPSAFGARSADTFLARPFDSNQFKPLRVRVEADRHLAYRDLIVLFRDNDSGSGPVIIRAAGTNLFHVLTTFWAAADYLKWTDPGERNFDMMREALKRPYARMAGDYNNPPMIPLPNFVALRLVAQTLAQRAQCHLLLGQPDKALRELTLMRDLCRLTEGAPTGKPMTLVAAMINAAVTGLYVETIADGFRLHTWQEPQIVTLQKQLEQINLPPFLVEAIHCERLSCGRIIQTGVMAKLGTRRVPNATLWQKIRNVRPPNILGGFFYLNLVNVDQLQRKAIASIDPVQRIVLPKKAADFQNETDRISRHFSPYTFFAAVMVPDFSKAVQTCGYDQTRADVAQLACALERYRFAHGRYPEKLDDLLPQFIGQLPHDIVGGQSLKYRCPADGGFVLYSIGWNETDDGGRLVPSSYDQGDWGWRQFSD
jgi:hypothetical protein